MKSLCPKCGAKWAILNSPVKKPRAVRRKRVKPALRRRVRPMKAVQPAGRESAVFGPARIRRMRNRVGISQKKLAGLVGVNRGPVAFWEVGKFKPKQKKIVQLQNLAKMKKGKVSNLFPAETPPLEDKKTGEEKAENAKRKERVKRKKSAPR